MSTTIGELNSLIEVCKNEQSLAHYENRVIKLVSFPGGTQRGKCLQISYLDDNLRDQHFQLDNTSIQMLRSILNTHFSVSSPKQPGTPDLMSCLKKKQDWILKKEINFFGKIIPEGTVYQQVSADYYHPIVKGNGCPSLQVDFYIIKNNPEYFIPYSYDIKEAFDHKKRCIRAINTIRASGGEDLAVMFTMGDLKFSICDNNNLAAFLSNEVFQADMFISGDKDSKF